MLPILHQSLWRDEAFSILLAMKHPFEIIRLTARDVSPPLYYIMLHYWMALFGSQDVVVRSLSFAFHTLTVLGVFLIARHLVKSWIVQVLITFATLLNPFLLQYAFEARPYSMLACLIVFAAYGALTNRLLLASLFLGLSILTHNFAVLSTVAFAVWWVVVHRFCFSWKTSSQLFVFPIIALIVWGSVLWNQWTMVAQGFWIKQTTSSIFLHSLQKYSTGDITYGVQDMLYTLTLILLFFSVSHWVLRSKISHGKGILLVFFIALIPTIITYLVSSVFVPIYHERYLIAAAPMIIILIGYSLYQLYCLQAHLKMILVAFVSMYLLVLVQASEQIVARGTKPPINYAVSQVLVQAEKTDIIVPQDVLNYLETKYYVLQSGKQIPVYAYSQTGKIPFYVGNILFEEQDIIREIPNNKRVWIIKPDGSYKLQTPHKGL